MSIQSSQPAFPQGGYSGLSVRLYLAAHAPINMKDVLKLIDPDDYRMADALDILADLRLAYADAVIARLEAGK